MPNMMTALKAEIVRLARKEIKGELAPVKRVSVAKRGLIASLRRQVNAMQKDLNALKKAVPAPAKTALERAAPEGRFWITGQGVKALRKRLGLTQAAFGKLAGVTSNAVVKWEGTQGKIGLRKATAGKLQEIRGMKKRDLAGMMGKGGKAKTAKKSKSKAKAKTAKRKS